MHPEHASRWYKVTGVFVLLGIVMIALAGARTGPNGHLNEFNTTLIIGYIAFFIAAICFAFGIRQARFPFARTSAAPPPAKPGQRTRPDQRTKPGAKSGQRPRP